MAKLSPMSSCAPAARSGKKGQEQGKQAEQGGRQKHRLERAGTASGIDARPSSFDGVEPYGPARKVPAKSNPE
jgi:hypothetical protein